MPLRDMDREQVWLLPPSLDELLPLDRSDRTGGRPRQRHAQLGQPAKQRHVVPHEVVRSLQLLLLDWGCVVPWIPVEDRLESKPGLDACRVNPSSRPRLLRHIHAGSAIFSRPSCTNPV